MSHCTIEGCEKKHLAKGMCSMHYRRVWSGKGVGTPGPTLQKHGLTGTKTQQIWANIRQRTSNPNYKQYPDYGGRGIKMCQGWWSSLISFKEDIGERPTPKHTIDRIDNDGNYSCGHCDECTEYGWPMNVRWATRSEQLANQRIRKSKLGVKGVREQNGRYVARISHKGTEFYIGRYGTIREATIAYNEKAIELFGEFAVLNPL